MREGEHSLVTFTRGRSNDDGVSDIAELTRDTKNSPESFFANKTVLITGGTGSIGKTVFQEIMQYKVKEIIIFSRDEFKQKQMKQKYRTGKNITYKIGDVRNYETMLNVLHGVDVVFHTAAQKDVVIDEVNPLEAIETNVTGTKNVIFASTNRKVSTVVNISTDKAVTPRGVLGATKLLAERLVTSASKECHNTVFCNVRYGNVLGSRGSIVPLFRDQIVSKSKVEITDPEMTRFIMSLKEACSLVIDAALRAKGGETFVLNMKAVRLDAYANNIVSCITARLGIPHESVKIEFVGPRPGERKHEELLFEDEIAERINDKLLVVNPDAKRHPSMRKRPYSSETAAKMSDSETQQIISRYLDEEQDAK